MLAAVALIAALIATVGTAVGVRWWTWRPVVTRRVLVQTDADVSFEGVVLSRRGPLLELGDVTIRTAAAEQRLPAPVIIERRRVVFMQRVA